MSAKGQPQVIQDALWLPTGREIWKDTNIAVSLVDEMAENQVWLEYYTENSLRRKYDGNVAFVYYWSASPSKDFNESFRAIDGNTSVSAYTDDSTYGGIAPAFCVW
jgi:hypothetical protein